jgi:hypothetical protein
MTYVPVGEGDAPGYGFDIGIGSSRTHRRPDDWRASSEPAVSSNQ